VVVNVWRVCVCGRGGWGGRQLDMMAVGLPARQTQGKGPQSPLHPPWDPPQLSAALCSPRGSGLTALNSSFCVMRFRNSVLVGRPPTYDVCVGGGLGGGVSMCVSVIVGASSADTLGWPHGADSLSPNPQPQPPPAAAAGRHAGHPGQRRGRAPSTPPWLSLGHSVHPPAGGGGGGGRVGRRWTSAGEGEAANEMCASQW
jgi:hypothetical protein